MEEWKEYKIKDVTSILGDGIHGTPKYDEDGPVFFINGNNFENGKIVKTEFIQYGKIILSQKNLKAEDADIKSALCFSVQKNGFDSLPLDERTKNFLVKRKFYEQASATGGGNLSLANDSLGRRFLGLQTFPGRAFFY